MAPNQSNVDAVDKLYNEASKGRKASEILELLDPLLEKRLGVLLDTFRQCPPDLGPLLDYRAQICEIWRMRKELKDAFKLGKSAEQTLEGLLDLARKNGNR